MNPRIYDWSSKTKLQICGAGHGAYLGFYTVTLIKNGEKTLLSAEQFDGKKISLPIENTHTLAADKITVDANIQRITLTGKSGCCMDIDTQYRLDGDRLKITHVRETERSTQKTTTVYSENGKTY